VTRRALLIAAFCLLHMLTACSVFDSLTKPPEDRYQRHIDRHEYIQAIDIAERQHKKLLDKDSLSGEVSVDELAVWSARTEKAMEEAVRFQQREFVLIRGLQEKEEWRDARERTEFLLVNTPESSGLEKFVEAFEVDRQNYIKGVERSLLLLGSQAVPEAIAQYERIDAAGDDTSQARRSLKHLLSERLKLIESLSNQLRQAEENNNDKEALALARALQRVDDTPGILEKITAIRERLAANKELQIAGQSHAEEHSQQQLNAYGKALIEKRWVEARELLDHMLKERPDDGELQGQDTYLKEIFQREVFDARVHGEQLYAEGKIEEALAVWQSVVKMAPDDLQLAANIQRAQRILAKVKELKSAD